jgi:Archaea bacterial proteins of unknown function.
MGKVFENLVEKSARGLINGNFSKFGKWWYKGVEIDLLALNEKEVLFGECKWQNNVNARKVLEELKAKSKHVKIEKRNERYAIFARSFKEKSEECMCFDMRDMERIFK